MEQVKPGFDAVLALLRDLDGVQGSFLISARGQLLGRDIPRYFDDGLLAEVGLRAVGVLLSLPQASPQAECVIRFEGHKLHARLTDHGVLCVLLDPAVHMPSLRTAVTMVTRKLAHATPRPPNPRRSTPPPPPTDRPGTTRGAST